MSTTVMSNSVEAKDKLRRTGSSPNRNGVAGTVRSLQTKNNGRPKSGGGSPKLNGITETVRSLQTKSSGRPKSGGGSPKLHEPIGTIRSQQAKSSGRPKGSGGTSKLNGAIGTARGLQTKSSGRPIGGGGSPKLYEAVETVRSLQALGNGRPKGGGGSPKIAAAYNSFGNDCIRLAAQQSALLDTAVVINSRAIEYDPDDPGLMVNLAITNLIKGDTLAASNLFVMAFVLCEDNFDQLYALMGLKHGQVKYPHENPLHKAEAILRAAVANSITKAGAEADAEAFMPEEAKEFLYIKRNDAGEK